MTKDLTKSSVDRQNILNNPFAVAEIENAVGLKGIPFEGRRVLLLDQTAYFFEVNRRTIERCVSKNREELNKNGYETLKGNRLNNFKNSLFDMDVTDISVGNISKAPALGVFDFRAFVNLAMLLTESERAKQLRHAILDIVIDTINHRTGGGTKYINQRDEEFLQATFSGENYRKKFTDSLKNYVDMGNFKYPLYTDKIYEIIFLEKAREYRKVLDLQKADKTRDTFYSEILDIIASFENGFAHELEKAWKEKNEKLSSWEVDSILSEFSSHSLWEPMLNSARVKMASRDLAFRDALHKQLVDFIIPIEPTEFERFLGDKSKELDKRLEDAKDVMKRLKDR